jgi:hypothetical protein
MPACPFRKKSLTQTDLKWTSPKTHLLELVYGLKAAGCFNSGKVSLNRIACYFGEVFSIDLSGFSRDFYEMRTRNDRTPLLTLLNRLLITQMDSPRKPCKKRNTGFIR